jgi:hypothetical protein
LNQIIFIFAAEFDPVGLNIPVGWRLPSYKILKGSKEFKGKFYSLKPFNLS